MKKGRKIKILQKLLRVNEGFFNTEDLNPFMPARIIEEVRKDMEKEAAEIKKKVNNVKSEINHLEGEILRRIF